jgi:hypothetical protein
MDAIPPSLWHPAGEVRQLDAACTSERPCWEPDDDDHERDDVPEADDGLKGSAVLKVTAEGALV